MKCTKILISQFLKINHFDENGFLYDVEQHLKNFCSRNYASIINSFAFS